MFSAAAALACLASSSSFARVSATLFKMSVSFLASSSFLFVSSYMERYFLPTSRSLVIILVFSVKSFCLAALSARRVAVSAVRLRFSSPSCEDFCCPELSSCAFSCCVVNNCTFSCSQLSCRAAILTVVTSRSSNSRLYSSGSTLLYCSIN